MPAYTLSISHVDTCLPCYVQDHCNGDDEMLLGVPVDSSSRNHQVRDSLIDEVRNYGDKLPDSITDNEVKAAIIDLFKQAHPFGVFERGLDKADDSGESAYAWFRFTWESADE